ncbi:MAG: MBL fold metallo-hydrolase [Rubrivivax sp.]
MPAAATPGPEALHPAPCLERSTTRRAWLHTVLLGATAIGSTAAAGNARAAAASLGASPGSEAPADPIEVASGVYMVAGLPGAPEPENQGRIGNAGFIVGRAGVMAIDTGISYRNGQMLLGAIASITALPVKLVLLTEARQEFLFGAAAFQERGIAVHMQRDAAALMAQRCANCLKTLRAELGEEEMRGTAVVKPDMVFDNTHVVESIGRPVLVQFHGRASGPGASSAFDVRTATLFAGGLLEHRRIPDIQDGDLEIWRGALVGLRGLRVDTIVPGHGPAGPASELIAAQEGYLSALQQRCAELLQAGAALSDVADRAALPAFERWDQYDVIHRRNAAILFLRLESRLLQSEPVAGAKS